MTPLKAVVCDANILIDYLAAGHGVLRLAAAHCCELHVPDIVVAEVRQLDGLDPRSYGLCVEASDGILAPAMDMGLETSKLSLADCVCYVLAKSNGWACLTNDRALGKRCERGGVEVRRGLSLMLELAHAGHLGKDVAVSVAREIHRVTPTITADVLAEFLRLLGKL